MVATNAPASAFTRIAAASRLIDWLVVLAISTFAALVSRPWPGFNSPDSEFYATLALHGEDVAGRSLDPAYTWTRLGYIAPVRLAVTLVGPWAGFWLWRFLLIVLIVGSLYAVVRMLATRELAVIVAGFASLNTVLLSYVGNTYLTGTVIAGILGLLACAVWGAPTLGTAPARPWLPPLLAGAMAGWLVMVNPYGFLLGMALWLGVWIVGLGGDFAWSRVLRDAVMGTLGFAVAFLGLLASGLVIFPGRSWFGTYLEWNDRLDYASFVGDATTWQRDSALLVPLAAILVAVVAVVATRSRVAVASLVVTSVNAVFTVGYLLVVPGPWLEAPTYVAKLWPGALMGIALAFTALVQSRRLGLAAWVVAVLTVPLLLWSGRFDQVLTSAQAWLLLAGAVLLVVVAATGLQHARPAVAGVLVVAALAGLAISAQVLQNGRGLLGTYGQYPFRAAFVDFDGQLLMESRMAAEEFVLSRTTPDDRIAIWTDPDRLTAAIAAMQLWGWYNNVGSGPTLNADEAAVLESLQPTAVAMYAPTREQIDAFWASLPPWSLPTTPECTTVPYLGIGSPDAHVCVTHLRW